MQYNEIGLCAENVDIILRSVGNTIGLRVLRYDHLKEK